MRSVTRRLFRVLNNEDFLPVEFLDLVLPGGALTSAIHLTNAGAVTVWNGFTYTPVAMSHTGIEDIIATDSQSVPSVTLNITNVDKNMAALLASTEIEGSHASLYQCDRRLLSNPRDNIILTVGEVRSCQITEQSLTFQILNVVGLTEKLIVPRRCFQQDCNATFGSPSCGVNLLSIPFSIPSTSQTGTSANFVVVNNTVLAYAGSMDPTEYWADGYILFTNGPATLQARPIQAVEGNRFYLRQPFFVNPGAASNIVVRRGCRKTKSDCQDRQGNVLNYQGFEDVPYGRVIPHIVDRDTPPGPPILPVKDAGKLLT